MKRRLLPGPVSLATCVAALALVAVVPASAHAAATRLPIPAVQLQVVFAGAKTRVTSLKVSGAQVGSQMQVECGSTGDTNPKRARGCPHNRAGRTWELKRVPRSGRVDFSRLFRGAKLRPGLYVVVTAFAGELAGGVRVIPTVAYKIRRHHVPTRTFPDYCEQVPTHTVFDDCSLPRISGGFTGPVNGLTGVSKLEMDQVFDRSIWFRVACHGLGCPKRMRGRIVRGPVTISTFTGAFRGRRLAPGSKITLGYLGLWDQVGGPGTWICSVTGWTTRSHSPPRRRDLGTFYGTHSDVRRACSRPLR
jgi:hypothetical protein